MRGKWATWSHFPCPAVAVTLQPNSASCCLQHHGGCYSCECPATLRLYNRAELCKVVVVQERLIKAALCVVFRKVPAPGSEHPETSAPP